MVPKHGRPLWQNESILFILPPAIVFSVCALRKSNETCCANERPVLRWTTSNACSLIVEINQTTKNRSKLCMEWQRIKISRVSNTRRNSHSRSISNTTKHSHGVPPMPFSPGKYARGRVQRGEDAERYSEKSPRRFTPRKYNQFFYGVSVPLLSAKCTPGSLKQAV